MDYPAAADPHGFRHAALFYRDPDDFTAAALDFVQAGAAAGEAVLVVLTSANLKSLRAPLDARGKLVTVADLTDLGTNPGRVLAMIAMFVTEHRGETVRCVQDLHWPGRPPEELTEALRYELLASRALDSAAVSLLCAYDLGLDSSLLIRAQRSHPIEVRDGRWRPSQLAASAGQAPEYVGSLTC
ncbi:MAG TPA: MEDS domain-containing protein [Streptosporangiaceae bacterium]|nr:MEDS domain-containing protein [Streptosporangiaceae bacterium]